MSATGGSPFLRLRQAINIRGEMPDETVSRAISSGPPPTGILTAERRGAGGKRKQEATRRQQRILKILKQLLHGQAMREGWAFGVNLKL